MFYLEIAHACLTRDIGGIYFSIFYLMAVIFTLIIRYIVDNPLALILSYIPKLPKIQFR